MFVLPPHCLGWFGVTAQALTLVSYGLVLASRHRTAPADVSAPDDETEQCSLDGIAVVEVAALRLLWNWEQRGLDVRLNDDGGLIVDPPDALTFDDRCDMIRHRDDLRALVQGCSRL